MLDRLKAFVRPAPERKASHTARLITLEGLQSARWMTGDYAALARQGYLSNAVVHRSVRLVAESAASLPILAYEGAAESERHPLPLLLAQPNPRQDGATLLETLYTHLLLAGNAYLEAVSLDGAVRELYALRPDRMRVVPGADGWAQAYDYTVGGRTMRFVQDAAPVPPLLHLSFVHPLDDHYGFAPGQAAAAAIEGGTGDLRYKLSKQGVANTLSLLFQTGFSGRAELGLAGDDDFHFKLSADGASWTEALLLKPSGQVQHAVGSAATPAMSFSGRGGDGLWSPAAGGLAWSLGGAEAARLNGSGLGVGGSPARKLDVFGTMRASGDAAFTSTTAATSTATGALSVAGGVGIAGAAYVGGGIFVPAGQYVRVGSFSNDSTDIGQLYNKAASGSAMVCHHTAATSAGACFVLQSDSAANYLQLFRFGASAVGTISHSGTTGVSYNTTSDRSRKTDLRSPDDAGAIIDALQVYDHAWKNGAGRSFGVIAQDAVVFNARVGGFIAAGDAEDVDPETAEYRAWGADYSKLVPLLIAEVQHLRQRVARLEAG